MPTINDLAGSFAQRLRAKAIHQGAKEYADVIRSIKVDDIKELIAANKSLMDILPRKVLLNPLARRIAGEDPTILLEILEEYNPELAKILKTPEGKAWWRLNTDGNSA